ILTRHGTANILIRTRKGPTTVEVVTRYCILRRIRPVASYNDTTTPAARNVARYSVGGGTYLQWSTTKRISHLPCSVTQYDVDFIGTRTTPETTYSAGGCISRRINCLTIE